MEDNNENLYLLVDNVFKEQECYLAFDGKPVETGDTKSLINPNDYLGSGTYVYLVWRDDGDENGREDGDAEITVSIDGRRYGFDAVETLGVFPLIEGTFKPGIYRDDNLGCHIELRSMMNLSKEYVGFALEGYPLSDFKLICREDSYDLCFLDDGKETHHESFPTHPFSYFDLYCPICYEKVVYYELMSEKDLRCDIKSRDCGHYIGNVETVERQLEFRSGDN